MFLITTKELPTLQAPEQWSEELREFQQCCLQKDPETRPTASELLHHPFLEKACDKSELLVAIESAQQLYAE